MTAHRYWRLRSPDTAISGEYMAATEIELRETPSGADVTGSGTASASANLGGSWDVSKAVDNNAATAWTTGGTAPPSGGHWWAYDFGLGNEKDINEVSYTSRFDSFREDPLDIYIEFSDNGSLWFTQWSVLGMSAWSASETRVWTDPYYGLTATDSSVKSATARVLYSFSAEKGQVADVHVRTLFDYTAETASLNAVTGRSLWDGEGGVNANANQLTARILLKYGADIRQLRAWTFTQDDHDFYGLQLGEFGTLIHDKLSGQWAQWKSPDFDYWRVNDAVAWEGWNIGCDTESGKLWIIDPEGRKDYETTPITSVVTSGYPSRMRKKIANYSAEVCISEAAPPSDIDAEDVGITLRTSDDEGKSFLNHGEIPGVGAGEDAVVRWYGLGLIEAPGRLYEITDTGYARRIDGFNVEVEEE